MVEISVSGVLRIKLIRNPEKFIIQPNGWDYTDYVNAGICYIDANNEMILYPKCSYDTAKRQIVVEHMQMPELERYVRLRWRVFMYYEKAGQVFYKRLANREVARKLKAITSDAQTQAFRYGEPMYEFQKNGKDFVVLPVFNPRGRMNLMVKRKERLLLPILKAKIEKIHIEGSMLSVVMFVKHVDYYPGNIRLQFRTEKVNKERIYLLDTTFEETSSGGYRIYGEIDLEGLELRSIYWDIVLTMYSNAEKDLPVDQRYAYYVNAYNISTAFRDQFLRLRQEVAYRTADGFIFFPYVTKKDTVAFKYREIEASDSFRFRLKERVARTLYTKFSKIWDKKNIYLVYEKYCLGAQDNGYYFFKYCMENKEETEKNAQFYYVIDKKSPEYSRVKEYGNRVVQFLSIRHMIYLLAAKLLISTDSKPHAYVWRQKGSVLYDAIMQKKNVFLQHGVLGFKDVTKLYHNAEDRGAELFIVSSKREKKIVKNSLGYPVDKIAVTGLARWDVLKDQSKDNKEILIMPTWRSWLDTISEEEFVNSTYYKNYKSLLTNQELLRFLEEKDTYVTFYLHPIMRQYIHLFEFDNSRIRVIHFGEVPLNELLMQSKLLITDYSSASWDMFYMKKPVLFFQFDVKDYLDVHGSYVDFENELFGESILSVNNLVDAIKKSEQNNYMLEDTYDEIYQNAFKYVDNNNSKRIYRAIQKMMAEAEV